MKHTIFILLMGTLTFSSCAQNLRFEVRKPHERSLKMSAINNAGSLSQLIKYYPASWIEAYDSVEIRTYKEGIKLSAVSPGEQLSAAQKRLLQTAGPASEVEIEVSYKSRNSVLNTLDNSTMHMVFAVAPETEASYPGGNTALKSYFQNGIIHKLSEPFTPKLKPTVVRFTVNERGVATNAVIMKSSGNKETDNMLLKAVKTLPRWKPAVNLEGKSIPQVFEFVVETADAGGC